MRLAIFSWASFLRAQMTGGARGLQSGACFPQGSRPAGPARRCKHTLLLCRLQGSGRALRVWRPPCAREPAQH
jgi:hypothetical protein